MPGYIKTPLPAVSMAAVRTSRSARLPWSAGSRIQAPKLPGTTAGRWPMTGMTPSPLSKSLCTVIPAGATPYPQITSAFAFFWLHRRIGQSPPGPF